MVKCILLLTVPISQIQQEVTQLTGPTSRQIALQVCQHRMDHIILLSMMDILTKIFQTLFTFPSRPLH